MIYLIKVVVIGSEIRHEGAFAAILKIFGIESIYIHFNGDWLRDIEGYIPVKAGGKPTSLRIYQFKSNNIVSPRYLNQLYDDIRIIIDEFQPDIISSTQGYPLWYVAKKASSEIDKPLLLRIWALNPTKIINYIAYKKIYLAIFYPSLIQMLLQANFSTANMSLDSNIYNWISKMSVKPNFLVYPSYLQLLIYKQSVDSLIEFVDNLSDGYILVLAWLYNDNHPRVKLGGELLLKLACRVATYNKDIPVLVAGVDRDEALDRLNTSILPGNLYFIGGWLRDKELEILYRNAKLVMIPFYFTLSNKFLEALSYGAPIITNSTTIKLYPELGDDGYFIVEDDLNRYPMVIRRLIRDDDELERLREGSREAFQRFFSAESTGPIAVRIIKSLLEK